MLSFKELKINKDEPSVVKLANSKEYIKALTEVAVSSNRKFPLSKITLFNKPKPKIDKALARVTEPGYKIPIGQFHSVSQWCETCQDVQGFAHKPEKRRMICLICKTIKTY